MKNLTKRVIVAFTFGPIIVLLLWLGGYFWLSFLLFVSVSSMWEYSELIRMKTLWERILFTIAGVSFGCLLIFDEFRFVVLGFVGYLILQVIFVIARGEVQDGIENIAFPLVGVVYLGIFPFFAYKTRYLINDDCGRLMALFVLLLVWGVDTAAYFGGEAIGRHKLAENISPKKTREGFLIGIAWGIVFSAISYPFIDKCVGWWIFLAGFVGAVMGQLGDLFESLLKRRFGVKDSSNIIPGHGGILDRFDSFTFVQPFFYILFCIITGARI